MMDLNATLDHDVPCASVGACLHEMPDGTFAPCDSAARAKDCTGIIPAGEKHCDDDAGRPLRHRGNPNSNRYCRYCVREMNDRCADQGPILVKVELTYSDGTVRYLEDDAADDWAQQSGSASVMAWAHGCTSEPLPWKERRR